MNARTRHTDSEASINVHFTLMEALTVVTEKQRREINEFEKRSVVKKKGGG